MAWEPTPGMSLSDAFYDIMKKITHRDWNRFARTGLGLEQDDIDEIRADFCGQAKEQKYRMLERWMETVGSDASVQYLYDVLNHYLFPDECPLPVLHKRASIADTHLGNVNSNRDEFLVPKMAWEPSGFSESTVMESKLELSQYCSQVGDIAVLPCTQDFFERNVKLPENYTLQRRRGSVLIINNSFVHCSQSYREGSEVDLKNMTSLWQNLGCDIKIYKDIIAEDVRSALRTFSDDSKNHDYYVVFIMSHGTSEDGCDVVLGNDGERITVKEILEIYNNKNSPKLQGKPKLFFFQCCRGDEADAGVALGSRDTTANPSSLSRVHDIKVASSSTSAEKVGGTVADAGPITVRLPTVSDMLVAYATQSGQQAFRNTEHGSWFVNAIANVFMRHAKDKHILDMMVEVNRAVATKSTDSEEDCCIKAMSHIEFTLTKNLYLFPGSSA